MATTKEETQTPLLERLFEAGAHFGFSKSRRHPSVAPFLFGSKQGSDIFDLEKTSVLLTDAATYIKEAAAKGSTVLFVGTKEEISGLVRTTADSIDTPFITHRWIGGILTNISEIKKRINRLTTLKAQQESGELDQKYTKKERLMVTREIEKLELNFGGIEHMEGLPHVLVVVDPRHESIAVKEAQRMNIPVVAIMGSDCDVSAIEKPVIMNDSHRASVTLALETLAQAYTDGRSESAAQQPSEEKVATSTEKA